MAQSQKEYRQEMMDRLAKCFGAETGEKVGVACRGKWAGTTDYSVKFNNGERFYISNGMKGFDKVLADYVTIYENFSMNKDVLMNSLRDMEASDNEKAAKMGLKQYHIKDIKCTQSGQYLGWFYGVLEIDGKETTISETGFNHSLTECLSADSNAPLLEYISKGQEKDYYVAGGLDSADFVFHGVGFDTQSPMYKGHEGEKELVLYKEATLYRQEKGQTSKAEQER